MKGIPRYAARRDSNEAEIVAALRAVGALVTPLSSKGVGDDLVLFRDVLWIMEVKTPKGKLTPEQVKFHEQWGAVIFVPRSVDDALRAVGAID